MATSPAIGNFKNAETAEKPAPQRTEGSLVPEVEAPAAAPKDPQHELQEKYQEQLANMELSEAEARAIMNKLCMGERYTESFMLGGSIPVTFQTRSYNDTVDLNNVLEAKNPRFQITNDDIVARYNLAASLAKYGDHTFPTTDDGKDKALEFLMNLPNQVVMMLSYKLSLFDQKVMAAFSEGSVENFF